MRRSEPERLSSLADATRYLDGLINRERSSDYAYTRLDLRPIEALLDAVGRPHERLSVIHVAGSKGKGSTCLLTEAILTAVGERVGTFTSPHLESWVERFRIAGREVDEARLVAAVERVRPAVDALRVGPAETQPSFFDATTAIAFLLFAEAGVDRAVVEVGLGGRLDSTNVVRPTVTCITSIELEHVDKLGPTEAAIAGEKAGILKPGVPAVLGRLRPEAEEVIRRRAALVGAPIRALGEHFEVHAQASSRLGLAVQRLRFESKPWAPIEVELPLLGEAAIVNAALAIECVRALGVHEESATRKAATRGLSGASLPGRIEILPSDPAVIIDAAHTERSAQVLARTLASLAPQGCAFLLSISSDKNVGAVLEALLPSATRIWLTRSDAQRSLDPASLAEHVRRLRPELRIDIVEDPVTASRAARAALGPGERL
ncbi:bifunctional folylpolyglutamate synthase/dihydrofolate synthase, partial [Myxococcota bacterium]|nr:bifunctional folylpolyglutamate synthase/dihydrofolate synthase [Myxococcota bacterium]